MQGVSEMKKKCLEMKEISASKVASKRGWHMSEQVAARFPFINLAKSLDRAKAIFDNDKGGKGLKMPVAFSAWGYSDKSSGGFQTVAALKGYGLLEDEGSNEDRVVKLTPNARRYFQTELEDDKSALAAKFAAQPSLMRHLLEHWENGTVDDPVARTYLKTGNGLNEQSARSALGIYKDNLSFILHKGQAIVLPKDTNSPGGGDSAVNKKVVAPDQPPVQVKVGDQVQWTIGGVDRFTVPRMVTDVVCDPDHGWFVSIRGEEGKLPMEQITVVEQGVQAKRQVRDIADATFNPIEVFMTAEGRLQITANVNADGLQRLIKMLQKYQGIINLDQD